MAHERYDAPNHPRWDTRSNRVTPATSRWQSGRARLRRATRRTETTPSAGPPLLTRARTGGDAPVELHSSRDRLVISAELPDRSIDDVRVIVDDAAIRLRAAPPERPTGASDFDRTIALVESVDAGDAVIAYRDPTLTVVLPKRDAV